MPDLTAKAGQGDFGSLRASEAVMSYATAATGTFPDQIESQPLID